MSYTITLENDSHPADVAALRAGLRLDNLVHVPELVRLPTPELAVVARNEIGNIIGGTVGNADWGWFFVDIVWVDRAIRGQGLGSRLMAATERAVYERGVRNIYLVTTSFQALPFYQKLGYEVWGELADRPRGYQYYYLKKENLQPPYVSHKFEIESPPLPADHEWLEKALMGYIARYRPVDFVPLAVMVRKTDARPGDGNVLGGIVGSTYWDWFDLSILWIDDSLRGTGLGSHLLALAEEECIRRGVYHITCDTADFQALPFYQKHGFEIFGTLPNRPPGHTSYYLRKSLSVPG